MPPVSLSSLIRSFTPTQFESVATGSASEAARQLADQCRREAAAALSVPDSIKETASVAALQASQASAQNRSLDVSSHAPAVSPSPAAKDSSRQVGQWLEWNLLKGSGERFARGEGAAQKTPEDAARQAYRAMQACADRYAEASAGAGCKGSLISTTA